MFPNQLFTTKDSKRGMKLDENLVLRALRAADAGVGEQYLEHLVLIRRNSVCGNMLLHGDSVLPSVLQEPALSTQLATSYIERLVSSLEDPEVVRMWRTACTYRSAASRSHINCHHTQWPRTLPAGERPWTLR